MIDWHDKKIYPPRVVMTIMPKSTENRVFVLPVTVDGCSGECQLDVDLTFPLGKYSIIIICKSRSVGHNPQSHIRWVEGFGL